MDRSISNQQIEPHQNVSSVAAMLFADLAEDAACRADNLVNLADTIIWP
jgi:hypothetical protein